ncbi:MAG: hypothetical protein Q7R73_02445 [bacterium]|nr:hypothetical protein [bacterium]
MHPMSREYEPKTWKTYEIVMGSEESRELDSLLTESTLVSCGEESPLALDHWERARSTKDLFFYDTEQVLGMNMDKIYGVDRFGVLTKEWRGHPAGSLVFSVYSGVEKNPPTVTLGVTITS